MRFMKALAIVFSVCVYAVPSTASHKFVSTNRAVAGLLTVPPIARETSGRAFGGVGRPAPNRERECTNLLWSDLEFHCSLPFSLPY
jgi:hypothetical protein